MFALIITTLLVIFISAACSLAEVVLYSVPLTYIEQLRQENKRSGIILAELRNNIEKPITAILTLNTLANTAGATIAGAFAVKALGQEYMIGFAIFFSIGILLFSEILPKTIGANYAKILAPFIAIPIFNLLLALKPFISFVSLITKIFRPKKNSPAVTADDIKAITNLSKKIGSIKDYEKDTIINILSLAERKVENIMTPRTVVYGLPHSYTVKQAYEDSNFWHYSRIPVYMDDLENMIGIVLRRNIVKALTQGKNEALLEQLMTAPYFVPETMSLDRLLAGFLKKKEHLFGVVDEYGGLAGVVSLEDVLEEILGHEIVDETDSFENMQELARKRKPETTINNEQQDNNNEKEQ